jgi:excisionase family DNA binding protein
VKQSQLLTTKQADDCLLETPREIANLIRATSQTVRNWHRDGIIPAKFAVGRIIRFDRAEVLAALAAHSKTGGRQ